jgi:hypothetical protein
MDKTITRVAYLFLIIGIAMLVGAGYWMTRTQAFVDRSETVPGEVIDLERSRSSDSTAYYPVIKYKTKSGQERTFRSNTGSSPPSYDVGEKVEVMYDVAEPSDARIRSFFSIWGGPAIVGLLGTLFGVIGGGILYVRRSFAQRAEDLRRRGMPIQTDYQGVEQNRGLQVNGRSPWCIVTQWKNPTTGELHLFRSANLWFDPTAHIQGRQITVYVDRKNPKRYYMDVSFLPKLAQ